MARDGFNGGTFTNRMTGAPVMPEKRLAAVLRSRAWHEQRTAAGKCHRCPKPSGRFWYCFTCRLEIAQLRSVTRPARRRQMIEQAAGSHRVSASPSRVQISG